MTIQRIPKKSPYTSFDYSSLKLILLVDGRQCDYITKSKEEKKQNLGINLKYNKNLFSLKIQFPKKLLIFAFLETKNYEWIFVIEKLRPKDCEISPRKNKKKNQLPPTLINLKVNEVFEDWILKGWGNAECECRNRYCVFSRPHLHH